MQLAFLALNLSFVPCFKPEESRLGTKMKLIWNTVSLQFAFWAETEQPRFKGHQSFTCTKGIIDINVAYLNF